MEKFNGPIPQAQKRRRNADPLQPIPQGTRRGKPTNIAPDPNWCMPARNYFNAALNSGQSDYLEPSDVMALYVHVELLDRLLRQSRVVPVFQETEVEYFDNEGNSKRKWVPILDDDGNKIPELDRWGEPLMRTVGSLSGQSIKAILDQGASLLITEGDRRRLRIDLAQPQDDSEPAHKAIIAKQREDLQQVLQKKKSST